MHLSYYTNFITELSAVIDSGKHTDITVDDVLRRIEGENIIPWLKSQLKDDIDLSLFEENAEMAQKLNQDLLELHEGYSTTKWGIKNNGLCLLISWTASIIANNFKKPDQPIIIS